MNDIPRTFDEPAGGPQGDPGLNPREFVSIVRRRWWAVLGVLALVIGIAYWHVSQQVRIYRASTTVRIQEQPSPLSTTQMTAFRDYRVDPVQSEQEVIRSRHLGERVADRMGLRLRIVDPPRLVHSAVFGEVPPVVDSTAKGGRYTLVFGTDAYELRQGTQQIASATYGYPVGGPGFSFTVPHRPDGDLREVTLEIVSLARAGSIVRSGTSTRRLPETNVVVIQYTGPDPVYVKLIADAITSEYEELSRETRQEQWSAQARATSQEMTEQRVRLAVAQDSLRGFKQGERITDIGAEQAAMIVRISELEQEKAIKLVELGVFQEIIGGLSADVESPEELRKLAATPAVQGNDYLGNLYNKWFEHANERQRLISSTRLDHSRDVVSLDSMIASTTDEIRTVSGLYLQGLQSQIASLEGQIQSLRQEMSKYPALTARESRLAADVRMAQGIYENLLTEYQRAIIAENSEAGYVRQIDEAQYPSEPIAPRSGLVLMTAGILGLLLGLGLAIGMERLDDSIKSPDELRDRFGIGLLGTIPGIKGLGTAKSPTGATQSRLVTHLDPRSPVAEAYRSLRTNLAFSRAHAPPRSIIFTSPGPSDGKSTTVANLAITFAQQGQRTLLIDADLRRAVLDNLFNVPRTPGLTDVLVGQQTLAAAVKSTHIENLFVLGSGPFPSNPSELLGSSAMRELLVAASEQFDMVLLDSPPLLAVTDAAVLSTLADAAVLVVRMGETSRGAVARASSQLQTVRGHLVGAVLNDVDFGSGHYYGGYGYYYHTYYGSETNGNGGGTGVVNRLKNFVARTPSKH